jgi:hypothetical protein
LARRLARAVNLPDTSLEGHAFDYSPHVVRRDGGSVPRREKRSIGSPRRSLPEAREMLLEERKKLGKKRDRASTRRGLATANGQSLVARSEVYVGEGQFLSLCDARARVTQKPRDDAVVVRTIRVQNCSVLVRT